MNPYIFNFFNGVIVILVSLWAFAHGWNNAGFFMILGLVLLLLTYYVRDSNKIFGSIAMFSTILSTIVLGILFFLSNKDSTFSITAIAMMMTSGFITSLAFIQCAANLNPNAASCGSNEEECTPPIDRQVCASTTSSSGCCDSGVTIQEDSSAKGCC